MSNTTATATATTPEDGAVTTAASATAAAVTPATVIIDNYIGGASMKPTTGEYWPVTTPHTNAVIASVAVSNADDVEVAVQAATKAFPTWGARTVQSRASVMLRFHALLRDCTDELAALIVKECGKNLTEALAEVAKGMETIEYACGMASLAVGHTLQVSSRVHCRDTRRPLGVVTSIVPFNFPFMVPMWTFPIAAVLGNCVILKPSEKVPLTLHRVSQLIEQAGFPPGVYNLVHGGKDAASALLSHPSVQAVTFVGSSPVAQQVAEIASSHHKACIALGGAKNHLVALNDCDVDTTANDVCVSFAGCAGQRCMAASVLLLVGPQPALLDKLVKATSLLQPGSGPGQMGPVIDTASLHKVVSYIESAEKDGAKLLLDGRSWTTEQHHPQLASSGGNWIGPTIVLHQSSADQALRDEIFGPVLSVYVCDTWDEAIAIENASPYGNAASIYTTNGGSADWFIEHFQAGMLGINVGIPVPREPFSFGGLYGTRSKYGNGSSDITGDSAIEFFTHRIKITSQWPPIAQKKRKASTTPGDNEEDAEVVTNGDASALSHPEEFTASTTTAAAPVVDRANFAGSM